MSSPAAGACVLVVLGVGALAVVYAVSPTAGVLTVWVVGTAALACAARRRMSDSSATPPPRGVAPGGDVYADESTEIARVVRSPEGVMCVVHPVREEVNGS
jgi:hypothetical protein